LNESHCHFARLAAGAEVFQNYLVEGFFRDETPERRPMKQKLGFDLSKGWPEDWRPAPTMPQTIILISLQVNPASPFSYWQAKSYFCGLQRLGLLGMALVLAINPEAQNMAQSYGVGQVIFSMTFLQALGPIGMHMNVRNAANRIAKLLGALVLLEHNRTVLLSDIDTMWFESPFKYLDSIQADVTGCRGYCWIEMNSGFLWYRPTEGAKSLLRTILGYSKNDAHDTDNDQHVFNCGWAYHLYAHALNGAHFDDRIFFGVRGTCQNANCNAFGKPCNNLQSVYDWHGAEGDYTMQVSRENAARRPTIIWHTSGMTHLSMGTLRLWSQLDKKRTVWTKAAWIRLLSFGLWGLWDLDADGTCRGTGPWSDYNLTHGRVSVRMKCQMQWAPECRGNCMPKGRDIRVTLRIVASVGAASFPFSFLSGIDYRFVYGASDEFQALPCSTVAELLAAHAKRTDAVAAKVAYEFLAPKASRYSPAVVDQGEAAKTRAPPKTKKSPRTKVLPSSAALPSTTATPRTTEADTTAPPADVEEALAPAIRLAMHMQSLSSMDIVSEELQIALPCLAAAAGFLLVCCRILRPRCRPRPRDEPIAHS